MAKLEEEDKRHGRRIALPHFFPIRTERQRQIDLPNPNNAAAPGALANVIVEGPLKHSYPIRVKYARDAEFKEEQHPRGTGGQFKSGGGQGLAKQHTTQELNGFVQKARGIIDKYNEEEGASGHHTQAAYVMRDALREAARLSNKGLHSVHLDVNGDPTAAGVLDRETGEIPYLGAVESGHGKIVMRDLLQKANDNGLKQVHLKSVPGAVAFYSRLGFKPTGLVNPTTGLQTMSLQLSEASLDTAFDSFGNSELDEFLQVADAEFKESEHKRDEEGKFATQAGGGAALTANITFKGNDKPHATKMREALGSLPAALLKKVGPINIEAVDKVFGGTALGEWTPATSDNAQRIVVARRASGMSAKDLGGSMLHEFGHAVDNALGRPSGKLALKQQFAKDVAKLDDSVRRFARYYFLNASETFAEMFRLAYGPPQGQAFLMKHDKAMQAFGDSVAALKQVVEG